MSQVSTATAEPSPAPATPAGGLGDRAFKGFAWMLATTGGAKVVTLGSQMILAWLLTQTDYGLVGLAFTVTAFTSVIQRNGLREILVQRGPRFSEYANSAFWLSVATGVTVSILTLLAAPLAVRIYRQPSLLGILAVLALSPTLQSMQSVPGAQLQNELRFRALSLLNLFEGVATGLLTIVFALAGCRAYSIVLPLPIVQALSLTAQWRMTGMRPRFTVNRALCREMIGGSLLLVGASALYAFNMQGANMVLGLFHSAAMVGVFFFAFNISSQITGLLTNNLWSILLPSFSNLQGDPVRQTNAFLRVTRTVNLAGMFVCFVLAAIADPLLRAFYGTKWVAAIPVVQILSLGMTFNISFALSINLIIAQGRFSEMLWFNVFRAAGFLLLVTAGALAGGPAMVALGTAIFMLLFGPVITWLAIRPAGYGWQAVAREHTRPFIIGALSCGAAAALASLLPGGPSRLWLWVRVGTISALGAIFWLVLCKLLMPESWEEIRSRMHSLVFARFRPARPADLSPSDAMEDLPSQSLDTGTGSGSGHLAATLDLEATPDPGARRLAGLDGLRGLAIIVVMIHHFMHGASSPNRLVNMAIDAAHAGWWGVDLFFVLSGFLITGILYDAKGSHNFFGSFYARRILRIFPLYYGVLFVAFCLAPLLRIDFGPDFRLVADKQIWLWLYGTNLLNSVQQESVFGYLNHFWTLAVEEHFYLFWPFIVFSFSREGIIKIALAFTVGAAALRLAVDWHEGHRMMAYVFTPCRLDALTWGAALSLASRSPAVWIACRKWAGPVAAATASILILIFLKQHGLKSLDRIVQTVGYSLLALLSCALIVLSISGGRLRHIFESPVLRSFGKYSYGLYVFHYPLLPLWYLLFPLAALTRMLHGPVAGYAAFTLLSICASFAVAWMSWHAFEKHFLRFKRYFPYRFPSAGGASPLTGEAVS